jgi:EAL domain-containing protein (putative c-di-GMP-specific phosphodiesterase class I)
VQDTDGAEEFSDLIGYYGMTPRRVCVEVLEDGGADEAMLRKVISAYRELGSTIAMDDFGLGRSNFDRIVSLRPDLVKIDRAILVAAVGDSKSRSMLPAIVELLHEAGSQVAVEGIESVDEALIAMESGADLVQGHFFGAPGGPALADEAFGCGALARLSTLRLRPSPVATNSAHLGVG